MVEWWNGIELWVLGLAFPLQFALVIVLLAPLCVVVAWAIDRVVDHASVWFGPSPGDEPPIGAAPEDTDEVRSEELVESAAR